MYSHNGQRRSLILLTVRLLGRHRSLLGFILLVGRHDALIELVNFTTRSWNSLFKVVGPLPEVRPQLTPASINGRLFLMRNLCVIVVLDAVKPLRTMFWARMEELRTTA